MTASMHARVDGLPLRSLDDMIWIGDIPGLGARQHPQRDAIIFADRGERMSYAQFDQRCDTFVALMRARGLKAGDRIAYLGKNSDLYFPVLLGAIRGGFVLVPLNWRLAAPEIRYQLEDSQSRLLICDPDLMSVAAEAGKGLPLTVLATESETAGEGLRSLLLQPAPACPIAHDPDQVVLKLYTSGTTGKPKGVLISHAALSVARHSEKSSPDFDHIDDGVSLSAMPNFHVGGMSWVLIGLIRGATVVLTADPSPANMLKLLREYKAEHTFIVPTVLRAIIDTLRAEQQPAPKMKGLTYGAMAMDQHLLHETMTLFGCPFIQFFGMTENTGSATNLGPQDHDLDKPHLLKSVGKPYPGMSIEIRGADRQLLKRGEHGEIWIRSPTQMLGYWNLPEKTREAVVDGWYASGDGGYVDDEGYLFLTDRIKDMIVSGGENVYPVEVEEALRLHPAVLDAAVVGLPDARWGELVVAVIELRPGQSVDEEALRQHARSRIAAYKCPKQISFGTLPRTASGKVQRALVRQQLQAAQG